MIRTTRTASKADKPSFSATDLLELDAAQILEILQACARDDGPIDISSVAGVSDLSGAQKVELAEKLRGAHLQMDQPEAPPQLEIDILLARLSSVANKDNTREGITSAHEADTAKHCAPDFRESFEVDSMPNTSTTLEEASYNELVRDGGRPICSVHEWSQILCGLSKDDQAIRPWLGDSLEPDEQDGERRSVFTTQFTRWWDFRWSQWERRGLRDSADGFSAYLAASRARYGAMFGQGMTHDESFEATMRFQWEERSKSQHPGPPGQTLSSYQQVVRRRLKPFGFRIIFLKRDPMAQSQWTNWLEYLSFEQESMERLTSSLHPLEEGYHMALTKLWRTGPLSTEAADKIKEFFRDTALYNKVRLAAYRQRLRVEWAVEEARKIDSEGHRYLQSPALSGRASKRPRSDEDLDVESRPKRPRRSKRLRGTPRNINDKGSLVNSRSE